MKIQRKSFRDEWFAVKLQVYFEVIEEWDEYSTAVQIIDTNIKQK